MKERIEVCPAADLPPGERRLVDTGLFIIGVFNVNGEYYALKNDCPHQRAPLCEGRITGTTSSDAVGEYTWTRDGEIIQCPWHGWEFDITTGRSVFNPHRVRAKTFETSVEPTGGCGDCENMDSSVESFEVDIEDGTVVVHF